MTKESKIISKRKNLFEICLEVEQQLISGNSYNDSDN